MNGNINNVDSKKSPLGNLGVTPLSWGLGVNNNNEVTINLPFRGLGGNKI